MTSKQNTWWKRIALISLVASLVALMAAPAFAQHRRERQRLNIEYDGGDRIRERIRRRPVSSVPEPSAALLFAGGGLIVAQAIRSNRRKQQK